MQFYQTIKSYYLALVAIVILAMTAQTAWAAEWPSYITDVVLVGGTEQEAQNAKSGYSGYTWCSKSLNDGTSGDVIYIGYKTGNSANTNGGYITDFVVVETGSSHNPSSTFSLNGKTYSLCPYAGGNTFANDRHGNLTSQVPKAKNMYLYYTKANFSDKRAVSGITITTGSSEGAASKSGAINCYNTNGNLFESEIDLNKGAGCGTYVYMHIYTETKVNRPYPEPTTISGLTYDGTSHQLIPSNYDSDYSGDVYFRLGTTGSYTDVVNSITATNAGTYTIYYYSGESYYGNSSVDYAHTISATIAKSPNSAPYVTCSNILESSTVAPELKGTNLSTGTVTYKYSTSQNGTYTTTKPTTAGTYWVKATIAADNNCNEYTTAAVSFKLKYDWGAHNSGNSENDAYVISTIEDLNLLSERVNAGNSYFNKYFKLGANITLNKNTTNNFTPIGTESHPFSGTFDGKGYTISGLNINKPSNDYVGLFGYANGATIKNLTLTNSTITGKEKVGGITGIAGSTKIANCLVTNSVNVSGDYYAGGVSGMSGQISGCNSAANVSATSSYAGGIVGYINGQYSNSVDHCLYTGNNVTGNSKGAIVGSTFNPSSATLTANYYTQATIGGCNGSDTDGARKAVVINAADGVTVTPTGDATVYNVSGITAYDGNSGMLYSDGTTETLYAGQGETVSLDITCNIEGFSLTGYNDGVGDTPTALTHVSDNTYTLEMTANAPTVTPVGTDLWGVALSGRDGTAEHPYLITTPAGLDLLAKKVNGTDGYTANDYNGKYFELGADIEYDGTKNNFTSIGTEANTFGGHFDGKGYTISGIYIESGESYKGLFGKIVTAEVKNLTLDNSKIEGLSYCGGIAGYSFEGTISNCHVTTTVTVPGYYTNASNYGGIVGYINQSNVIGCTSSANVTAEIEYGTGCYGGIAGYSTNGTIQDCLVYSCSINASDKAGAVVGSNSSTLTNNYYSDVTLNGSEAMLNAGVGSGSQDGTSYICAIIPYEGVALSIPSVSATTEYPYNGLKIYPTGISYNGQYYNYHKNTDAGFSGDVTFTATYTGSVQDDALSGFGSTTLAYNTNVTMQWAATDGSATCTLNTYLPTKYYIFPITQYAVWGDGDGSQGSPYIIKTVRGMDELASKVNSGTDLSGKYFELGADITYDGRINNYMPIGTKDHKFSANFDGKGYTISGININTGSDRQGIFGHAAYCTIQNLTLTNSTIINGGCSGGIFGWGEGVTVSNCNVTNTVTMHATGTELGGIGGYAMYNSTIQGCTSAAKLSFKYNYNNGGIMGGMNGASGGTFKDCLYRGPKFDTTKNGAILGFVLNSPPLTNNYNTVDGMASVFGSDTDGARKAIVIGAADGVTVTPTGTATAYNVSGITTYDGNHGMLYSDGTTETLYAGATETVSLDIAYAIEGFNVTGYTDGNGNALTHVSGNTYTLTMTANAPTVTPVGSDVWGVALSGRDGTAEHPYLITTPAGLDLLASKVNGGTNYNGKYFELGADIEYDGTENNFTPIGGEDYEFCGHFDGKGHTIRGININTGSSDFVGIFVVNAGMVKNLTVSDCQFAGDYDVSAVVTFNFGTVENCHVTSDVTVTGKNGVGGVVDENEGSESSVKGCSCAATIKSTSGGDEYFGGIASINTGTLMDNLFTGTFVDINAKYALGAIAGHNDNGTLTNNFHTVDGMGGVGYIGDTTNSDEDGARYATSSTEAPDNLGDAITTYAEGTDYEGITVFENGLVYNGQFYSPSPWSGSGIEEDPYVIYTPEGLDLLASRVNSGNDYDGKYFALGADITYDKTALTLDLDGEEGPDSNFPGIGDEIHVFYASLDGRGHTISGIVINRPNYQDVGLFGYAMGDIKNLTLANSAITGEYYVGAIVGFGNTNIENCHVTSDVTVSGQFCVGGIVGIYATIQGCTSAATVSGSESIGGILGNGNGSTVRDCLYLGNSVTATSNSYVGAIVGGGDGNMENNYHTYYGHGGIGSIGSDTGDDVVGALFAVTSANKPDAIIGDPTAVYGEDDYIGITAYSPNGLYYNNCYYWLGDVEEIDLEDDGINEEIIVENDGKIVNVLLAGRTFRKDGKWSTIVLPFDVDLTAPDCPLQGAIIRTLPYNNINNVISGTTLNLTFGEKWREIDKDNILMAGQSYLIRWNRPDDYEGNESMYDIVDPLFIGVKIKDKHLPGLSHDGLVSFDGNCNYMGNVVDSFTEVFDVLLLGDDNNLHYATPGESLGACRACFVIHLDMIDNSNFRLTNYVFDLGNGEMLSGTFPSIVQPVEPGDANGDGSISVTDIAVVVNCILQLDNTGGFSPDGADANGDGQITVTDIGVIVDKILGVNNNSGNAGARRLLLQEVEPQ